MTPDEMISIISKIQTEITAERSRIGEFNRKAESDEFESAWYSLKVAITHLRKTQELRAPWDE